MQRAAAAQFHKTVVLPAPALLAAVVGKHGGTIQRITRQAAVGTVTTDWSNGAGCAHA